MDVLFVFDMIFPLVDERRRSCQTRGGGIARLGGENGKKKSRPRGFPFEVFLMGKRDVSIRLLTKSNRVDTALGDKAEP
jgi:hypothetical protein